MLENNIFDISIIVPVYNVENTIEKCVNSIMDNNNKNIEIILIDDYSADNSYKICKRLKKQYKNINLCQTNGKGVSAARNTGLKLAKGKIVGFCDADDWLEKNALDIVIHYFSEYNIDILVSGFYNDKDDTSIYLPSIKKEKKFCKTKCLIKKVLNDNSVMGSVWNKFFKKRILQGKRFSEELSYCEDMHFVVNVLSQSEHFKCLLLKKPLYHYVYNTNSATNNIEDQYDMEDRLRYIVAIKKIIVDCQLKGRLCLEAQYKICTLAIDDIINNKPEGKRRYYLEEQLSKNKRAFLLLLLKYNWKWNVKRIYFLMRCYSEKTF